VVWSAATTNWSESACAGVPKKPTTKNEEIKIIFAL